MPTMPSVRFSSVPAERESQSAHERIPNNNSIYTPPPYIYFPEAKPEFGCAKTLVTNPSIRRLYSQNSPPHSECAEPFLGGRALLFIIEFHRFWCFRRRSGRAVLPRDSSSARFPGRHSQFLFHTIALWVCVCVN